MSLILLWFHFLHWRIEMFNNRRNSSTISFLEAAEILFLRRAKYSALSGWVAPLIQFSALTGVLLKFMIFSLFIDIRALKSLTLTINSGEI